VGVNLVMLCNSDDYAVPKGQKVSSIVSDGIWMKFGRIVLHVNMHRLAAYATSPASCLLVFMCTVPDPSCIHTCV